MILRSILKKILILKKITVFFFNQRKFFSKFTHPPILICGCARSGTTLLLSILDAHPNIQTIDFETAVFARRRKHQPGLNYLVNISSISHILKKQTMKTTANRWCEKTPANIRYIPDILREFKNEVRIIHLVRDGRDVITSYHPSSPDSYWVSPERWVEEVSFGLRFQHLAQVHTVKYEELVSNFEKTITKILNFLELEFDHRLLEFYKNTGIKESHAWNGVIKPVHSQSIQRWKSPQFRDRISQLYKLEKPYHLFEKLDYE